MTDHIPIPPRPNPLSPAAQAMLDAFESTKFADHHAIAAAIFELADQVVPEESEPSERPFADPNDPWPTWHANKTTRLKLLAIAIELENQP